MVGGRENSCLDYKSGDNVILGCGYTCLSFYYHVTIFYILSHSSHPSGLYLILVHWRIYMLEFLLPCHYILHFISLKPPIWVISYISALRTVTFASKCLGCHPLYCLWVTKSLNCVILHAGASKRFTALVLRGMIGVALLGQ